MKQWERVLKRRDFLKITAQGGAALLLSSCASGLVKTSEFLEKKDSSDTDQFLRSFGPIDRTLGDVTERRYFGDQSERPHKILWDLPNYLSSTRVEGKEEQTDLVIVGGGVSGLFSAYTLRKYKPILLEQASRFGGNAKGQSWNGMDYSIGAAYIDYPSPGTPMGDYYRDLNLEDVLVERKEMDPVEYQGKFYYKFWEGESDPEQKEKYLKLEKFLNDVAMEKERPFPNIPALNSAQLDSVKYYDQWSLHGLLEKVVEGKLPTQLEAAIEHYCWSTYAASSKELSAASGLYSLAKEVTPICISSGGNSKIAERVLQRLTREIPKSHFRPSSIVVQVKVEGDRAVVLYEDAQRKLRRIRAKTVIMACPKFVATRILDGIEPERLDVIRRLQYRSYMTANLLLRKKMDRGPYDVFMIANGKTRADQVKESQAAMNATDFIMGNFAKQDSNVNVLTFYRAFPYNGARAELYQPTSYDHYRKQFEDQIQNSIMPLLNFKSSDIVDLRLTLWGHALPVANPGFYRKDEFTKLRKPFRDRVFFIEQDNWACPLLPTGATDIALLKDQVIKMLG